MLANIDHSNVRVTKNKKSSVEQIQIGPKRWRYCCIHSVAFLYWSGSHKPCAIQRPVLIRMKAHFSKASAKCRRWLYTCIYPYIYVPYFRSRQCGCLSLYVSLYCTGADCRLFQQSHHSTYTRMTIDSISALNRMSYQTIIRYSYLVTHKNFRGVYKTAERERNIDRERDARKLCIFRYVICICDQAR